MIPKTILTNRNFSYHSNLLIKEVRSSYKNMDKKYNETYNEKVHKYTINIPIDVFEALKIKAKKSGILRVSIYLRAIIDRDIKSTNIFTIDEIIAMREISERVARREHREIRLDNIRRASWFKRKYNKIVDIFSDKQYTLWK